MLLVAGFVALGLLWSAAAEEKPASPADMRYVLTAGEIEPFYEGFVAKPTHRRAVRIVRPNKSWEVDYEYDESELYLLSNYMSEKSRLDAAASELGPGAGHDARLHELRSGDRRSRAQRPLSLGR